jgi:hypothetical protein
MKHYMNYITIKHSVYLQESNEGKKKKKERDFWQAKSNRPQNLPGCCRHDSVRFLLLMFWYPTKLVNFVAESQALNSLLPCNRERHFWLGSFNPWVWWHDCIFTSLSLSLSARHHGCWETLRHHGCWSSLMAPLPLDGSRRRAALSQRLGTGEGIKEFGWRATGTAATR